MNAAEWTISIIAIGVALVLAVRVELSSRRKVANAGARSRSAATGPLADATGEGSEGQKLEFMSSAWLEMARREISRALSGRDLGETRFALSEEFSDAPPHLREGDDTIGFTVRIVSGAVEVDDRPDSAADLRVISNYADALAVARDPSAASQDPDEASRRVAQGRLRIDGDPGRMPPALQELDIHALLAEHTA